MSNPPGHTNAVMPLEVWLGFRARIAFTLLDIYSAENAEKAKYATRALRAMDDATRTEWRDVGEGKSKQFIILPFEAWAQDRLEILLNVIEVLNGTNLDAGRAASRELVEAQKSVVHEWQQDPP